MNKPPFDAEEIIESLCGVGKEVTISITITNKDLASKVMGTMHGDNIDQLGFTVNTWGLFNVERAYQIREALITKETNRHADRMSYLNDPNSLKQLLDDSKEPEIDFPKDYRLDY
jgi:hypothetical protein